MKVSSAARLAPLFKSGAIYAILAYSSWGLLPIYWKLFGQISPVEVLSHRVLWSMLFLLVVLAVQHNLDELEKLRRSPKIVGTLLVTATILTLNWGLYIYGVNTDRVVETSLGYYINPLVNVLLGCAFLQERLNRPQIIAVAIATVGVLNFIWHVGTVPWIALALACSFGGYGLLRKAATVSPLVGLTVETLLMTPVALVLLNSKAAIGTSHWGDSLPLTLLFIGCGIVTSLPLLWFNIAAKKLRLSTLGFFQYLAPSLQLVLAVFAYREPFTLNHAITFGCVWSAIALYSVSSFRAKPLT